MTRIVNPLIASTTIDGEDESPNRIGQWGPLREILTRLGDKWTVTVLAALDDKRVRFNALHRTIDGISQRMLTASLRNLERDGLMVRKAHATVPPRVEYELSPRGRSLRDTLEPLGAWVSAHWHAIEESRHRFDLEIKNK
jgi:DNA-binding HxlR family transcriptional regulator